MTNTASRIDPRIHKKLATELFNHVWVLLEKEERTVLESDEMVHAAHASRFHWGRAGDAQNLAIGEWQISHVYAVLERPEPATYHAVRGLEICEEHGIGDFVLAYAYEALARAAWVAGRAEECDVYLAKAREAGALIEDAGTRQRFDEDLSTIG